MRVTVIVCGMLLIVLGCVFPPAWFGSVSHADDALVLPKGRARVTLDGYFYLPIEKRYNPDGNLEPVAIDYNRALDSRVFPLLAPLDRLVGGRASIGDSVVSFQYDFTILELGLQYGIADRLTVGVKIPYWWWKNTVNARLNSGLGSSANVGLNPRFEAPGQPPLIPLALGGVPLTTADVQQLLGPGLRGIPGFGFKRVETRSGHGVGDIEAGFRYQYFKTADWRFALTGGARFPTGKLDDPDDLVDYGIGRGAYALLFRLNSDYMISNLWKGQKGSAAERAPGVLLPREVVLNATFRYDLVLPDHTTKRVPDDVNNPITRNKENVHRDLGDIFEFEGAVKSGLFEGLSISALYKYGFSLQDHIAGKRGFAYSSLEKETAYTEHVVITGLSYTTLPLYLEKKFPFPLNGFLGYRNRFAGSNNVFKSEYITLRLEILF